MGRVLGTKRESGEEAGQAAFGTGREGREARRPSRKATPSIRLDDHCSFSVQWPYVAQRMRSVSKNNECKLRSVTAHYFGIFGVDVHGGFDRHMFSTMCPTNRGTGSPPQATQGCSAHHAQGSRGLREPSPYAFSVPLESRNVGDCLALRLLTDNLTDQLLEQSAGRHRNVAPSFGDAQQGLNHSARVHPPPFVCHMCIACE